MGLASPTQRTQRVPTRPRAQRKVLTLYHSEVRWHCSSACPRHLCSCSRALSQGRLSGLGTDRTRSSGRMRVWTPVPGEKRASRLRGQERPRTQRRRNGGFWTALRWNSQGRARGTLVALGLRTSRPKHPGASWRTTNCLSSNSAYRKHDSASGVGHSSAQRQERSTGT